MQCELANDDGDPELQGEIDGRKRGSSTSTRRACCLDDRFDGMVLFSKSKNVYCNKYGDAVGFAD